MNEPDISPDPLIEELEASRKRVRELEARLALCEQVVADQRHVNDCLPVLVATAGLDGYYKDVNAAFEQVLGWPKQESLSRPFMEFLHPDDRAAAADTFDRLKRGEPAVNFLDRNICRDGSYRWISWIVMPVPDRDVVFGIGQDVTDWKQAEDDRHHVEEAVRQSEQRLRWHVEQTPLAVIEWDLQLHVTQWNPGAERIFGYTEAEAMGRYFSFIVPAALHEQVDLVWSALRSKRGGERSTNSNVTKDGRTILCEWYNTPLVDSEGHVVGFASLAEDITERIRAEAALRESERRLATLISNLPGAVYRCRADDNWTIEFLSEGYRALTGLEPEELIGQPGTLHGELIHPDDRQHELHAMQEAVVQKRQYQIEYRMRAATGEEKWVSEQGTGVFSESGELVGLEGFSTDITARKLAEAALQKAYDELEQRIKERTAALESEQRALRRMVMASDHERRLITFELHDGVAQQLAAAILHLQRQDQATASSSPEIAGICRVTLETLRQASSELRMLMSRLRTPVLDRFGLAEAIDDMTSQLQSTQEAPQIDYRHAVAFQRLEPTLENALFRIAQEAVTNACRHSQSDRIRVELTQTGDRGLLEIRDWGIGFVPEQVAENRFGLEGIRERSRLLGATLNIHSEPGAGTVVRVEFPVIESQPAQGSP